MVWFRSVLLHVGFLGICLGQTVMDQVVMAQEDQLELAPDYEQRLLQILRDGLQSSEFWPAMHAAEGLTLAGYGEEVRVFLEPKLKTETDDQKLCGISRELVRAGDWQQARVMFQILDKSDTYGHTHACESLYKVFELGDGIGLRRAFESSENLTTRLMAAAALGRGGNPHAMKFLREQLTHDEEEIRKVTAWILARIGDPSDIPQLRKNLERGRDPLSQAYIVHALAMLGDEAGLIELVQNMSSPDPAIRTYAGEFAGEVRNFRLAEPLHTLLDDKNLDTRIRAAQSLLMFQQPPPLPKDAEVTRLVYPATEQNPRYTEGSIVRLANGNLLYATTEFTGSGSDFAVAQIVARESHDDGRNWGQQRVLQERSGEMNVMSVTLRRLQTPHDGTIAMFYLEKNSHEDLRVYVRFSKNEARTFGERVLVTTQPGYHVMNNDRVVQLTTGRLLVPVATTPNIQGGGHFISRCWYSDDFGLSWKEGSGAVDFVKRGAMEPEVIELRDGRVLMLFRTQTGVIGTSISADGGETWSETSQLAGMIAPEAPATLRRIPSTGDLLLIWNNTFKEGAGHGGQRTPLTAAISSDDGATWQNFLNLEENPQQTFSYTSLTFIRDRAALSYWVGEPGKYSSQFRSLSISWFYETAQNRIE